MEAYPPPNSSSTMLDTSIDQLHHGPQQTLLEGPVQPISISPERSLLPNPDDHETTCSKSRNEHGEEEELLFDIDEFLVQEEALIHGGGSNNDHHEGARIVAESPTLTNLASMGGSHPPRGKKKRKRKSKTKATAADEPESAIKPPKRPLSAYNLYFREERQRCLAEARMEASKMGGDASKKKYHFEELGKRIGRGWRSLCPEKKEALEVRAEADRERYRTEMAAYRIEKRKRDRELDEAHARTNSLLPGTSPRKNSLDACPASPSSQHHPRPSKVSPKVSPKPQHAPYYPSSGMMVIDTATHSPIRSSPGGCFSPPTKAPRRSSEASSQSLVRHVTESPKRGRSVITTKPPPPSTQLPLQSTPQPLPGLARPSSILSANQRQFSEASSKGSHVRKVSEPNLSHRFKNNASPGVSSYGSCSSWSGDEDDEQERERRHGRESDRRHSGASKTSQATTSQTPSASAPIAEKALTMVGAPPPSPHYPRSPSGPPPPPLAHPHARVPGFQTPPPVIPLVPPPPQAVSPSVGTSTTTTTRSSPMVARVVAMPATDGLRRMLRDGRPKAGIASPTGRWMPRVPPPSRALPGYPPGSGCPPHVLRAPPLYPPPSAASAPPPPPRMLPLGMTLVLRDPRTGRDRAYTVGYQPRFMTAEQANAFTASAATASAKPQP